MQANAIFLPMAALGALTLGVGLSAGAQRIAAVRRREISERFYRLFQGAGERRELEEKLTRHYANLLEAPVLFYVVGLAIYATRLVDGTFVALCWAFVAVRLVHAAIHLTFNRPAARAAAFGAGCLLLIVLWARFLILVSDAPGASWELAPH